MENVERWRSTATEPRKPRSPPAIFGKVGNLRQCRASGRAPLGLQKVLAGSEFPGLRPRLLNPTPSGSQERQSWAPSAKMAKIKGTFCLDGFPGLRPAPSNRTPLGHENGKVGASAKMAAFDRPSWLEVATFVESSSEFNRRLTPPARLFPWNSKAAKSIGHLRQSWSTSAKMAKFDRPSWLEVAAFVEGPSESNRRLTPPARHCS